jgi:FtsZ-binding cell division protein ZapB
VGHLLLKRSAVGIAGLLLAVAADIHPQLTQEQNRQLQQYQAYQRQAAPPVGDPSAWTTSYWDLGQNIKIEQINEHFKGTDANVTDLQHQNLALARELSDVEARSSVWQSIMGGGLLAALGLALTNFFKIKDK